jgi:hypothetical protein
MVTKVASAALRSWALREAINGEPVQLRLQVSTERVRHHVRLRTVHEDRAKEIAERMVGEAAEGEAAFWNSSSTAVVVIPIHVALKERDGRELAPPDGATPDWSTGSLEYFVYQPDDVPVMGKLGSDMPASADEFEAWAATREGDDGASVYLMGSHVGVAEGGHRLEACRMADQLSAKRRTAFEARYPDKPWRPAAMKAILLIPPPWLSREHVSRILRYIGHSQNEIAATSVASTNFQELLQAAGDRQAAALADLSGHPVQPPAPQTQQAYDAANRAEVTLAAAGQKTKADKARRNMLDDAAYAVTTCGYMAPRPSASDRELVRFSRFPIAHSCSICAQDGCISVEGVLLPAADTRALQAYYFVECEAMKAARAAANPDEATDESSTKRGSGRRGAASAPVTPPPPAQPTVLPLPKGSGLHKAGLLGIIGTRYIDDHIKKGRVSGAHTFLPDSTSHRWAMTGLGTTIRNLCVEHLAEASSAKALATTRETLRELSSTFCAAAFMSASGWSTGDVALHRYALENSMTPRGVAVEAFPTRSSGKRYSIESVMTFAIARVSLAMPCLLRVASCLGVRRLSFFDLDGGTSSGCTFDSKLSSAVDTDDRDALRGLARTVFGWPGVAEPGLDEEAAVAVVKSRKRLSTLARDILVHGKYDAELAQSFGPLLFDKDHFDDLPTAVRIPLTAARLVESRVANGGAVNLHDVSESTAQGAPMTPFGSPRIRNEICSALNDAGVADASLRLARWCNMEMDTKVKDMAWFHTHAVTMRQPPRVHTPPSSPPPSSSSSQSGSSSASQGTVTESIDAAVAAAFADAQDKDPAVEAEVDGKEDGIPGKGPGDDSGDDNEKDSGDDGPGDNNRPGDDSAPQETEASGNDKAGEGDNASMDLPATLQTSPAQGDITTEAIEIFFKSHCTVIRGGISDAVAALDNDPQPCELALTDPPYGNRRDSFGEVSRGDARLYCEFLAKCVRPGGYVVMFTGTTAGTRVSWDAEMRRAFNFGALPLPELLFQGDFKAQPHNIRARGLREFPTVCYERAILARAQPSYVGSKEDWLAGEGSYTTESGESVPVIFHAQFMNFNYAVRPGKGTLMNPLGNVFGVQASARQKELIRRPPPEDGRVRRTTGARAGAPWRVEQKSLGVTKELVSRFSRPGDRVIDLCVGTGTTAVAALLLGRDVVFGDADEEVLQAAVTRVKDALRGVMHVKVGATAKDVATDAWKQLKMQANSDKTRAKRRVQPRCDKDDNDSDDDDSEGERSDENDDDDEGGPVYGPSQGPQYLVLPPSSDQMYAGRICFSTLPRWMEKKRGDVAVSAAVKYALQRWDAAQTQDPEPAKGTLLRCIGERLPVPTSDADEVPGGDSLTMAILAADLSSPEGANKADPVSQSSAFVLRRSSRGGIGLFAGENGVQKDTWLPYWGVGFVAREGEKETQAVVAEWAAKMLPNIEKKEEKQLLLARLLSVSGVKTEDMESGDTLAILGSYCCAATYANDSGTVEFNGEVVRSYKANPRASNAQLLNAVDLPRKVVTDMQTRAKELETMDGLTFPLAWLCTTKLIQAGEEVLVDYGPGYFKVGDVPGCSWTPQ